MADDIKETVKESKADIQFLAKKLDAVIKILEKEGVLTKAEVEARVKGDIEGDDE